MEPLESHTEHSRAGNRAKKNGTCHTSAFQTLSWRLLRKTRFFLWPKTGDLNLPRTLTTGNLGISRIHFLAQYEVDQLVQQSGSYPWPSQAEAPQPTNRVTGSLSPQKPTTNGHRQTAGQTIHTFPL